MNFAQAGGRCIKHGYKKKNCSVDGCSFQSVACGLCKRHRGHRSCNVINCTNHVFSQNMCQFHYSSTNETCTVMNKSSTVVTTTDFITGPGTVTTNSFTATNKSSNFQVRASFQSNIQRHQNILDSQASFLLHHLLFEDVVRVHILPNYNHE